MSEQLNHNNSGVKPRSLGQAMIVVSLAEWAKNAVHFNDQGEEIPTGGEAYVVLPYQQGVQHAL